VRLGMVSTYPPRRCGVARYAGELGRALSRQFEVVVCAVDQDRLTYPDEVVAVIRQDAGEDYRRAARILAEHTVDAVLVQHAHGIYGGPAGAHVLGLTDELRLRGVPYLVTLHSLPNVELHARTVTTLAQGAAGVTVFTETARRLLTSVGDCGPVVLMPHGVPAAMSQVGNRAGPETGSAGEDLGASLRRPLAAELPDGGPSSPLLSTFGLLRPGKGLERAIAAMPTVLAAHPGARYVIVGETHPDEAREHGEAYRDSVRRLVDRLELAPSVRLLDAYLTNDELLALLGRTDVYLAPGMRADAATSGTLALAVAAGCRVVAAEHPYASETLRDRRIGTVVPAGDPLSDPAEFAAAVCRLLEEPVRRAERTGRAGGAGRVADWPEVARRTAIVVRNAIEATVGAVTDELTLPALSLRHIRRLTDEIGVIRGANGSTPVPATGYGIDEAARLAVVAAGLLGLPSGVASPAVRASAVEWAAMGLRLLGAGVGAAGLRSRLAYSGVWRDEPHLGVHVGRALWAAGSLATATDVPTHMRRTARVLADELAGFLVRLPGLPANAYAILGLWRDAAATTRGRAALAVAAARLDEAWSGGTSRWRWFEDRLGADAARLPQALICAGRGLGDSGMMGRGVASLDWYAARVGLGTADGMLRWGGEERAEDVGALVEAFVSAYSATRGRHYARLARRAFGWFLGTNRLGTQVYDLVSGGCREGLGSTGLRPDQKAESTLAYNQALLALLEAHLAVLPTPTRPLPELAPAA
jgi:glycosyltransferase involved in cell wall biosynthesis